MVVIGQSGCVRAEVVVFGQKFFVFGQKWLNSGKMVGLRKKLLYLAKVVVFEQE